MNKSQPKPAGRRGRGRPRGDSGTREQILEVARHRFLAEGYEAVTMRSLAADAGVDAALISYFFGSKRGLFGATMQLVANPADIVRKALEGPLETLPERLLHALLRTWDDPELGGPLRAMGEAALREPEMRRLLSEVVENEMIARIGERLRGPDAAARAGIAGIQLSGVVFTRYVLRLEPVASMPADELIARLAPSIRLAMAGPRTVRTARAVHT